MDLSYILICRVACYIASGLDRGCDHCSCETGSIPILPKPDPFRFSPLLLVRTNKTRKIRSPERLNLVPKEKRPSVRLLHEIPLFAVIMFVVGTQRGMAHFVQDGHLVFHGHCRHGNQADGRCGTDLAAKGCNRDAACVKFAEDHGNHEWIAGQTRFLIELLTSSTNCL